MIEYQNINYADKNWKIVLQEHIQRYKNIPNKIYLFVDNQNVSLETLNISSSNDKNKQKNP